MDNPNPDAQILTLLKERRTAISCGSSGEDVLRAFQANVEALQFFERIGIIQLRKPHRESQTGKDYVDALSWTISVDGEHPGYKDAQWREIILRQIYRYREESYVQLMPEHFAGLLDMTKLIRLCQELKEQDCVDAIGKSGGPIRWIQCRITQRGTSIVEGVSQPTLAHQPNDVITGSMDSMTTPPTASPAESAPLLTILHNHLKRAESFAANPDVTRDALQTLTSFLRVQLDKIYGKSGPHQDYFASLPAELPAIERRALAAKRVSQIKMLIAALERLTDPGGERVFIGHGRSLLWHPLKDFLKDELGLQVEEFNRVPVAGHTTSERLDAMLAQAGFAFLVMTAEEERLDSTIHARDNVIHEVGLFQGKLGRQRAIILLEEGCAEFSNIVGLTQIRFPKGDIAARFEDIRRVLKREGFTQ